MKKLLVLLALCMVLSVVLVACDTSEQPPEETTAGSTEAPTTEAPTTEEPTTEETTEAPTTEETTEAPTTETTTEEVTTAPTPDPDPVKVGVSFDEADMWIDVTADTNNSANSVGSLFTPGKASEWDKIANVEDYKVEYIRIWGWVAFFSENAGTYGYQIGDAEPVFDDAFSVAAEQGVIDVAAAQGGKSATRMKIMIPVRDLSGEVVIKALVKDAAGTVEEIVTFTMNKAVDPDAPVFLLDPNTIASAPLVNELASATVSEDGKYVTIVGANDGQHGDIWLSFLTSPVKGAQFIAIKYRTTMDRDGQIFVGSVGNPSGQNDNPMIDYTSDGEWHLALVDLSTVASVNEAYDIAYLRYDCFTNGKDDATIEVAFIAAFNTAEAAQAYFEKVTPVEPWDVDFSQAPISGSYAAPWAANTLVPTMSADELIYVVHYGSINLGEVDLGKYSKVTVTYGNMVGDYVDVAGNVGNYDNEFNATQKRVMLTNTVAATQDGTAFEFTPAEEAIIAYANYEQSEASLVLRTVEIDLTEVEYNGQTYLTFDFRNAEGAFGYIANLIVVTDIVFS